MPDKVNKRELDPLNVEGVLRLANSYRFLSMDAVEKYKEFASENKAQGAADVVDNAIRIEGVIVDNETADIYAEIGDAEGYVGPRQFEDSLNSVEGDLTIFINSPGGNVFEAVQMVSALENRATKGKVDLVVNGLSASAATYLLFAEGINSRKMTKMSQIMIHRSWSVERGNSLDFIRASQRLDSVDRQYADLMSKVMNVDSTEVLKMMTDETWFTTEEAIKVGLVNSAYTPSQTRSKSGSKPKGLKALDYATRALMNDL